MKETPEGVLLPIKAKPNAKRNAILGVHGGSLKVAVAAAPEKGKANEAVIELIAAKLGVARGAITLIRGAAARDKVVRIERMNAAELSKRLAEAL